MSMHRISSSLLVLTVVGCSSVGVVAQKQEFLTDKRPASVWVTGPDNVARELRHPQVRSDTLMGFSNDGIFTEMPMSDVKEMKAVIPAWGRCLSA